jgi:hypothetical protein
VTLTNTAGLVDQSIASQGTVADIDAGVIAIEDVLEFVDHHVHNAERWWGAVAAPDETNAIEANVTRPFAATSGNDTWGAAIPLVGVADNPGIAGLSTTYDPHEILVTDLDDDTTPWRIRLIYGTGTSANAITAGQWSERMIQSSVAPGNRAGGTPFLFRIIVLDVGTKLWAQVWNDTNGEVLSFFLGVHGYPAPDAP